MEGPPPLPPETLRESQDRLSTVEVSNEVVWVNPEIKAPFDMKEGEPTKLGVFISNEPQRRSIQTAEGHGRTGVFGKVIFEDTQGRRYRDVDAKGIGHVKYDQTIVGPRAEKFQTTGRGPYSALDPGERGIMDRSVALKDASMAEEFLSHGIRTYRVIGITKLNEVIAQTDSGEERMTIENAKEKNLIPHGVEPAVEVRAFGTRARVNDALLEAERKFLTEYRDTKNEGPINALNIIRDAQNFVAQELNDTVKPHQFDVSQKEQYLAWFASALGTNVGRMHKLKFSHGYLTAHNITLDCRIVDLDSVESHSEEPNIRDDIFDPYATDSNYDGIQKNTQLILLNR